jgi:hypothetical protein
MNDKKFQYIGHCGTVFTCDRCDFSTPIRAESVASSSSGIEALVRDVAEMIGWHAVNIHPELNGFQGYDTLQFKFNDRDDRQLPGHTAQPRNQTPTG